MVVSIEPVISLPNQDQLPCDDGVPMETQRHKLQMDILLDVLFPWLEEREDGYIGGNMFIYFSAAQLKNQDFKGPDFFAVLGVEKKERKSWVVWEEGKAPDVIIELLSESTAQSDKTEKKRIYQEQLRIPEYFWYDPFNSDDFAGFALENGTYQPLKWDNQQRLSSSRLGLKLVRWQGNYKGIETTWLRWATPAGVLLPTERELSQQAQKQAQQAQKQAQQAQEEADNAKQRAEKLAAKLQELGINPEEI